jgi:hypothetical protein
MLHTLIEQMILPLKDALNLMRFKAKDPIMGRNSVMQAEKKVFTIENSLPYLMRTAL